ncbi:MAG: hypothetical protein ABJE95_02955 [Byssovorax sp.]
MNKTGFLFLGAVLSIAGTSAIIAGCGGDTGTGTTTTGGGGNGTTSAGSTTGSGGGATSATSSTGTGAPATLDCASYCTEVMANCTGADEQYKSHESCLSICATFKTPGKLGDTDGNSLGCRIYHGGGPAVMAPDTHCAHAGITGGDKDVTDAMPGVCGEGCDAFCDAALVICAGANKQYDTKELCLTDCKSFKVDTAAYSTADVDKNDFGCRAYHLTVAATDAMSATAHCGHIIGASPVCTK